MHRFIAKANIDHYLQLLDGPDLSPQNRSIITKLLIVEKDKLSHDLEQLEFAEIRAANGRKRLNRVRQLRDATDPALRENAERLVVNIEAIQNLLEGFCHHLRERANSRP
jgi:hypothetical protein